MMYIVLGVISSYLKFMKNAVGFDDYCIKYVGRNSTVSAAVHVIYWFENKTRVKIRFSQFL